MTPAHFLLVFKYHERLLAQKRDDMKEQIEKYQAGLRKLKETQDAIHRYHTALNKQGPALQARLEQIGQGVSEIEDEF